MIEYLYTLQMGSISLVNIYPPPNCTVLREIFYCENFED